MPFATESQAKCFFVERIVAQAVREGTPLSQDEEWMLSFSESDPDFEVDMARVDAFEVTTPTPEYEAKVAGLAERAYATDRAASPDMVNTYKDAFKVLKRGDHYILVMLEQGLARLLRPWWALSL